MKGRKEEFKEGSAGLSDVIGFLAYMVAFLMIGIGLWNMATDVVMLAQKRRMPYFKFSKPYYLIQGEDLFFTGLIVLTICLLFSFLDRKKKVHKD